MARLAVAVTAILAASSGTVNASPASLKCKAHPSCRWPPQQEWDLFNKTVQGHLLAPPPPAGVCHTNQKTYNADQCAAVTKEWPDMNFHIENPVSLFMNQFNNDTCLPDPKAPCSDAGYPSRVVDARSVQDVEAAVRFARANALRLIVKSTGHDYQGRSTAPGALSVWVHHLDSINYRPGAFKLSGSGRSIDGNFVAVGGGAQMGNIAAVLSKVNQTIVSGQALTVSVGGYITGGGHSALSPMFGMAADNVVEMQVVLPTGETVIANQDINKDIYWAVLGGGGSTFGVVTEYVIKTHPSPKIFSISLILFMLQKNDTIASEVLGSFSSFIPDMMDAGLAGYMVLGAGLDSPSPYLPPSIDGFEGQLALFDKGEAEWNAIIKPFNETLNTRFKGQAKLIALTQEYNSYNDWLQVVADNNPAGVNAWMASRLLDKEALSNQEVMGKTLWNAGSNPDTGSVFFFLVGGKGVAANKGLNAVNPAWRSAYVHTITVSGFAPLNETAAKHAADVVDSLYQPLRDLTPNGGAYINEAFHFEKNWQKTFWGDNYDRLLQIKRRVDPDDVFWCAPCVGNERWQQDKTGKLCRV